MDCRRIERRIASVFNAPPHDRARIAVITRLSDTAIRACLAGRTRRASTRAAILAAARELGLVGLVAHLTAPAASAASYEADAA